MYYYEYRRILTTLLALPFALSNPFLAKQSPSEPQAAYISNLLNNARRLHEVHNLEIDFDITKYSIQFVKCQYTFRYISDNPSTIPFDRYVIFRLCPSAHDSCESECSNYYGEYAIELKHYLNYAVKFRKDEQDQMCRTCRDTCYYEVDDFYFWNDEAVAEDDEVDYDDAGDDGTEDDAFDYSQRRRQRRARTDIDCDVCHSACQKIQAMEDNYYLDATNFIHCKKIQEDKGDGAVYAGPLCASRGSKIAIGVFLDENCRYLDTRRDVENYLNYFKLSYSLLRSVHYDGYCIGCRKDNNNEGQHNNLEGQAREVCTQLYAHSTGKCEEGMSKSESIAGTQKKIGSLSCKDIQDLKNGTYAPPAPEEERENTNLDENEKDDDVDENNDGNKIQQKIESKIQNESQGSRFDGPSSILLILEALTLLSLCSLLN